MNLLPVKNTTIVSALSQEEIIRALTRTVEPPCGRSSKREPGHFLFTGQVWSTGFAISRRNEKPDYLAPRISGRIEPSVHGSILYLNFRLNRVMMIFLFLFTLLSYVTLVFFIVYHTLVIAGIAAAGAGTLNYLLTTRVFIGKAIRLQNEILWTLDPRKKLIS